MVKELKNFIYGTNIYASVNPSQEISRGVYAWCGSDDEETFKENIKSQIRKSFLKPYVNKPIEYKINKQHLRCDFDIDYIEDNPVDLFLGCSHTFGTGHYKKNTWPQQVTKATGNIQVNLGKGGGGIETSYLRLLQYIRRLNVKNVFHLQPPYFRYGYRTDRTHKTWIVGLDEEEMRELYGQDYIWNNYLSDGNKEYEYMKFLNLIRFECEKLNIPYFHSNMKEINDQDLARHIELYKQLWDAEETRKGLKAFKNYGDTPARDLIHYPASMMKKVGEMFVDLYDKYPEGKVIEAFNIDKALEYKKQLL